MRPKTEFRFQNAALPLARFDGVGRPNQNAALSLAHFSKPNSGICELRGEHLVPPQEALVRGAEAEASSPHADVLDEAEVAHLVRHPLVVEHARSLHLVRLDAPDL